MRRIFMALATLFLLPACATTGAGNDRSLLDYDELAAAISVTREPVDTDEETATVTASLKR